MSIPRFHVPTRCDPVELQGPEAHHLLHVLRLKAGEAVELFDGAGYSAEARIDRLGRSSAWVSAPAWRQDLSREPRVPLRLATALPKGKRLDWMLEKAVELGLSELTPLRCRRAVREAKSDEGDPAGWRRTCLEAARQCGRNVLPVFAPSRSIDELVREPPAGLRLYARRGAPPVATVAGDAAAGINVVIGPEGGLTDEEESALERSGWTAVGLGPAILRIETAALAVLAQLHARI